MSKFEVSKKVYFGGVWRCQTVNDQLLQQISSQNIAKKKKSSKGSSAVLNLSPDRLDVVILDNKDRITRTDQIPLQDVVELTPNKHVAYCLLAVVRDNANKQFYIFTFRCKSDKDAGDIVQGYGRLKQRMIGEGYNTDIKPAGTNWTLQEKHEDDRDNTPANGHVKIIENNVTNTNTRAVNTNDRVIESNERIINTNGTSNGHVVVINTERQQGDARVYTSARPVVSSESIVVQQPVANNDMKDELNQLAGEVRDIKLMLHKSRGRKTFEKHYQYLINGQGRDNETKHIVDSTSIRQTQPKIVVEQRQIEHRPIEQRPIEQRPIEQRPIQQLPIEQRPIEQKPIYREHYNYVQYAAPVKHHRSTKSVSSVNSGYSKRTYDSANPALEQRRVYMNRGQRSTGIKYVLKHTKSDHPDLAFRFHDDKINKKMENVYGRRSYRYIPATKQRGTSEYIRVASQPPLQHHMVHPTQERVKQYIEEKSVHEGQRQSYYNPEIRHIYENKDFTNEVDNVHVTSINQPTIVVDAPRSDPVVIEAQRSTVYENTRTVQNDGYENDVIVVKADTNVYKSTNTAQAPTENEYHSTRTVEVPSDDEYQHSRVVSLPTSTTVAAAPTIYNNTVYHIKAEGVDSVTDADNSMGYQIQEIEKKDSDIPDGEPSTSNDGLWESYVDLPDENAENDTIERQVSYRYHQNDGIGDGEPNVDVVEAEKEVKRVHYMEEIEQTINDEHDDNVDEGTAAIKNELDVITKQDEEFNGDQNTVNDFVEEINNYDRENNEDSDDEEDAEKYKVDKDELAKFIQEPNLVVIDREDLQLY